MAAANLPQANASQRCARLIVIVDFGDAEGVRQEADVVRVTILSDVVVLENSL